ncbi:hypothetical protein LAZ67_19002747 [Cordylochernes scorpioides]|uniref:ZP domain-containing protein n=1 Tax=Cordylochernes scorpioides TaxID=51811 RepID=A0ABY6LLC9_9ARAC|nr:hypothetical protein LAZ67_19002747 [Cordylochernes scorpioides]
MRVADVKCQLAHGATTELLTATVRKGPPLRGHPVFAANRRIRPHSDDLCQIRLDQTTESPRALKTYRLRVLDFQRCPVDLEEGTVSVRLWFPELDGLVTAGDQDVVIVCRPPEPTVTQTKAASYFGQMKQPSGQGRVSGVVEEAPGPLEYELALFRRSQPNEEAFTALVTEPVTLGTFLQLRAAINIQSAWSYAKLLEVTVSPDSQDSHAEGHVALIKNGCRAKEYESLMPHQPQRRDASPGEVTLEFQAFLLDMTDSPQGQLWVHARLKACVEAVDCLPEFCIDLYHPSGHGRRRRRAGNGSWWPLAGDSASVGENVGLSVVLPPSRQSHPDVPRPGCTTYMALSAVLGLLAVCTLACALVYRRSPAGQVPRLLTARPPRPSY